MYLLLLTCFSQKSCALFGNTNKTRYLIKQKQGKLLSQYFAKLLASAGLAIIGKNQALNRQALNRQAINTDF